MSLASVSRHTPGLLPTARVPAQRTPDQAVGAASPSSLVKVADAARHRCPSCGSARLTEIVMTLTDGTPVQFTSCRHCEYRSWTTDGEVLPVESVLTKATKRK